MCISDEKTHYLYIIEMNVCQITAYFFLQETFSRDACKSLFCKSSLESMYLISSQA